MFKKKLLMLIIAYWGFLVPVCNYSLMQYHQQKPQIKVRKVKQVLNKKSAATPTVSITKIATPTGTPKPTIKKEKMLEEKQIIPSGDKGRLFKVSAYDLSVQSCAKSRSSKNFGITRSGFSLRNQTRASAMTIAADLRIFKMGTKVYMTFVNRKLSYCDGIYTVRDTGSGIKGNKLDLFFGDFNSSKPAKAAMDFGVQKAWVKKID